jgi:hypothetical protein
VTVNGTINPTAFPGSPSTRRPLGNNPLVNPGIVGFQGLGNLGVGRVGASSVGGFVFSAASDAVNILVRALKQQGRIDILSRPQVMTLDNQAAQVAVGQSVPLQGPSSVTATGLLQTSVNYTQVGIRLDVTPKITPDGKVYMRVYPDVSALSPSQVNLGNGVLASIINNQSVETTIVAQDGETVVIGGLIFKRDQKTENKIPWFGDLPGVGAMFRFRNQAKEKRELLVILTPHIVRSKFDADKILAEESRRMDWILGDVLKTQGAPGMEPVIPPPADPGRLPKKGKGGKHETLPPGRRCPAGAGGGAGDAASAHARSEPSGPSGPMLPPSEESDGAAGEAGRERQGRRVQRQRRRGRSRRRTRRRCRRR